MGLLTTITRQVAGNSLGVSQCSMVGNASAEEPQVSESMKRWLQEGKDESPWTTYTMRRNDGFQLSADDATNVEAVDVDNYAMSKRG